MQGRRTDTDPYLYESGDYGFWEGLWYCCPKKGFLGCLGDGVRNHKVTEHEDKTITASPSILIATHDVGTWHGFLEKGVWREC